MSGSTTTTDPSKALMIPFKRVFTIVELDGAGCIVVNNSPNTDRKAYGASDLNEAIQVVQGWADTPPPAAPTLTSIQVADKSIAIPLGGTAEITVGGETAKATG